MIDFFCKICYNDIVMQTIASFFDEESPSIKRTGCRLTIGGGDSRTSATEINRQFFGKDGKVV